MMNGTPTSRAARRNISLDAVLLFLLVLTRVRVDTLTDAIVNKPAVLLFRIPFLASIFTPESARLMQD